MQRFTVDQKGINTNSNGEKAKIAELIDITSVQQNIDNGSYKALIKYSSFVGIKEITIPREEYLNKNNLIKYQSKGLDITHENVNLLTQYLGEREKCCPVKNVHTSLGFSNYQGKVIYKLAECIGIKSKYEGSYDIQPVGDKNEYINMLNKEVFGNTALEFIVIVSLSAILIGYMGEELGLDSMILHILGNSTTGKSTALKLAISLFGYPDVKKNGLFGTYNGTNNALIKKLTGLRGVPFALDEISMSYTQNFTNFIYGLSNGTDKDRLNKDSELKERETWLTTILSNGEKSLIGSANKNAGVQIRVMEVSNVKWTNSAENAESINQIILQNYGHIGFEFAKYVMDMEKTKLIEGFKSSKEEVYRLLEDQLIADSMMLRRCNKFGVIIQTAYLFENMMGTTLNVEGIKKMIVDIERESIKNRNFKESAIDYIKQYVSKYKGKFEGESANSTENLGKIIQKEKYVEVQMNKISFEYMIKQGGYEDKNIVLKELKEAGFLNCEKDRYTRCRKNSLGYSEDFFVIKLDK
ncbi:DUF927 domain-containing protein [uncultured Clostridium sp.]|uniref:DUF927 domain-containing protein n=1 Tax=uncultured Clostridium sp. TaxID=59620 RepID=UPI002618A6F2|nr:DUF927 domain-containing protein [uncultured Clostridium sp.]